MELSGEEESTAEPERRRAGASRASSRATWQIAVALVSLALAVACFARFGFSGRAVVGSFFAAVLVLLSAIDLDCRLIPNAIVLPALGICLVAQVALYPGSRARVDPRIALRSARSSSYRC